MKIKYSPCFSTVNTEIVPQPPNTVIIDGEEFTFDADSVAWDDIYTQTNGKIGGAYRENGELYLFIRRFYNDSCTEWDTGLYTEVV